MSSSFTPVPVSETPSSYQRRQPPDVHQPSPSTTANVLPTGRGRRPKYRGNFTTSICALFSNPSRRSDCCSIALCGVLASDRNRYLLLDALPPPWWRRLLIWVGLPLGLWMADQHLLERMQFVRITQKCQKAFPEDGSGPYLDVFNTTMAPLPPEEDVPAEDIDELYLAGLEGAHLVLFLSFILVVTILLARAASQRLRFRNTLMRKMYEMDIDNNTGNDGTSGGTSGNDNNNAVQANLVLNRSDARSATRTCGCYRAPDDLYGLPEDDDAEADGEESSGDLCTCLWTFVSTLFCRGCCGCWCQCCGMCSTAQESREIEASVVSVRNRDKLLMDYVTFQPFSEYFASLETLRTTRDGRISSHWKAMSDLAHMLMKSIGIVLLVLGIYALADIDAHFTYQNMIVVLLTLLQSFFLLYFVHWRWHRFDLSLDAVVKYFASGFLFSTSTAFIVEMLVSAAVSIATAVLGIIAVALEIGAGELDDETDPENMIKVLIKDNAWLGVLFMFMNAFVVAATTEELCKYFGFWMVEHPDPLTTEDEANASPVGSNGKDNKEFTIGDNDDPSDEIGADRPRRNLNSKGTGITIAMVCTAVGFACCENLKYVFSSADIETEIGTLIARSIFPVHALAAAIQSIGVCKRDLEGDKSFQLGRIILPAVILHGCFDFFLMVSPVLTLVSHADEFTTDDDNANKQEEEKYNFYVKVCQQYGAINEDVWQPTDDADNSEQEMSQTDIIITSTAFALSILSVVVGTIYYIVQARKQSKRLTDLDGARLEGSTIGLV